MEPSTAPPCGEIDHLEWDASGGAKYLVCADSRLDDAGRGVFVSKDVEPNVTLCEYGGKALSYEWAISAACTSDYVYTYGRAGKKLAIDAWDHDRERTYSAAGLINDSLQEHGPFRWNCKFVLGADGRVSLVTTEFIAKGQELYVPYGDIYWRSSRWSLKLLRMAHVAYGKAKTDAKWNRLIDSASSGNDTSILITSSNL